MDGGCLTDMEKDDIDPADFPSMKSVRATLPIQYCDPFHHPIIVLHPVSLEKVLEESQRCPGEWCDHRNDHVVVVIIISSNTSSNGNSAAPSTSHGRRIYEQICRLVRPEGRNEDPQRGRPHPRDLRIARGRLGISAWASQVSVFDEASAVSPRVRQLGWERVCGQEIRGRTLASIIVPLRAPWDDQGSGSFHKFLHPRESFLLQIERLPA